MKKSIKFNKKKKNCNQQHKTPHIHVITKRVNIKARSDAAAQKRDPGFCGIRWTPGRAHTYGIFQYYRGKWDIKPGVNKTVEFIYVKGHRVGVPEEGFPRERLCSGKKVPGFGTIAIYFMPDCVIEKKVCSGNYTCGRPSCGVRVE